MLGATGFEEATEQKPSDAGGDGGGDGGGGGVGAAVEDEMFTLSVSNRYYDHQSHAFDHMLDPNDGQPGTTW